MKKLILILTMVPLFLTAQPINTGDVIGFGVGPFISGFGNGVHEALLWRYDAFQAKYPNANPEWWNPLESWVRKHRNDDPSQGPAYFGSRDVLVWTTDAYHLSGAVRTTALFGSVSLWGINMLNRDYTLGGFAWRFGVAVLMYGFGNHVAYNWVMQ